MKILGKTIGAIAVASIGAMLYWVLQPAPVFVDVAAVARGPLSVVVEEEGKTRVIERYEITAPVSGRVQRVELDVGDHVKRDQPLITMEPNRAEMLDARRVAEAQARIDAREKSLRLSQENANAATAVAELAQTEFKRIESLQKIKHAAQDDVDRAQAELRRARAAQRAAAFAVDVARYELQAQRSVLEYAKQAVDTMGELLQLHAPAGGVVLKRLRESEGSVTVGQALLEIGDPASLEVVVDVLSSDAVKIKPAMRVELKRWGGDQLIEGVVKRVEPAGFTKISALGVEEQRVWVVVELVSPYEVWQSLGDGYRVEAAFVLWRQDQVLQVPTSALFRYENGWAVFVEMAGAAKLQKVVLGKRNGLVAQVESGLSEGQRVVTHPNENLTDGASVKQR